MDGPAIGGKHALVHGLADGRMREYRVHQLGFGGFQCLADAKALNEFGHFGANHMRAQQLAGLSIEHGFHQAFGLAQCNGLAIGQERETPGLGDRIDADASPWIRGFNNRSLENTPPVLWQVKKDGGDFDQFVGATVTPRAVVAGIYNALLFFEANRDQLLQAARQ